MKKHTVALKSIAPHDNQKEPQEMTENAIIATANPTMPITESAIGTSVTDASVYIPVGAADNSLGDLAVEIRRLHGDLRTLLTRACHRADKIGHLLLQVKKQLAHGKFQAWVEQNCEFTVRAAQHYMKFHKDGGDVLRIGDVGAAVGVENYPVGKDPYKSEKFSLLAPDDADDTLKGLDLAALRFVLTNNEHLVLFDAPSDALIPDWTREWSPVPFCAPYDSDAAWIPNGGAVVYDDEYGGFTMVWRRETMDSSVVLFYRSYFDKEGGITVFAPRPRGCLASKLAWRLGHGDHPVLRDLDTLPWKPCDLDEAESLYADLGVHPDDEWRQKGAGPFAEANAEHRIE